MIWLPTLDKTGERWPIFDEGICSFSGAASSWTSPPLSLILIGNALHAAILVLAELAKPRRVETIMIAPGSTPITVFVNAAGARSRL